MKLYYFFIKKFHFTYLYYNVITRNYRKSHSESLTKFGFFFGCQIRHKFVHQKLVCEFNIIFRCHSECTTRSTLILTPNVNSQGLLIRIATDENLRYIVLFNTSPAMWFDSVNVASPISRSQYLYCLVVMNTRQFVM